MEATSNSLNFGQQMLRDLGNRMKGIIQFAGGYGLLCAQCFKEILYPPFYWRLLYEQLYVLAVQSLLLVVITGFATGSVLALQFGIGLAKFGGKLYIPKIISLSVLREMSPVFTCLLVAGRIGSGMASEIASMKVTQQIDAIRALGTSPIKRIVIPRVLASMIGLPILTLVANFVGLAGAILVSAHELAINTEYFVAKMIDTIKFADVWTGLVKSMVFAFFIAMTACWKGLNTEGGTQGVGNSTTWVVVTSSIFIMIGDFFLTKIFFLTVYAGRY